jgi:hypothetical protein
MIVAYESDNPLEAHTVRGLLEAQGFAATVTGNDMAMATSRVWVEETAPHSVVQATIAAFLRNPKATPHEAEGWECPHCAERLEAQFAECWRCGSTPGTA